MDLRTSAPSSALDTDTLFERFFGISSTGRGEALFRIGFAAVMLLDLVGLHAKLELFFVSGGAHPVTSFESLYSSQMVHAAYWTWVAVLLLLLLGVFARGAAIANLALVFFFFGLRGYTAPHGGDWVAQAMAFCLVFMRSDRHWTLRLLRSRLDKLELVPGWPLRVAQLSYAGMYLTAGLSKLPDPAWRDGSAFESALLNPLVTRLDLTWVQGYSGILASIGIGIVLWELAYPFLLCVRRLRPWAILSAMIFHVMIDLTLLIGWFGMFAIVFATVFHDDLFPRSGDRKERVESTMRLSLPVRSFLVVHTIVFVVTHAIYILSGTTGLPPGASRWFQMPFVSVYVYQIAGLAYYNVFPSRYILEPVRLITYEARDEMGAVQPIPPFDEAGALRVGLFSREVREGLLALRIVAAGLSQEGWERYAEHLADRYARTRNGECPASVSFYGIMAPLNEFGERPKALQVPRTHLMTAQFDCTARRLMALEHSGD